MKGFWQAIKWIAGGLFVGTIYVYADNKDSFWIIATITYSMYFLGTKLDHLSRQLANIGDFLDRQDKERRGLLDDD